MVSALKFKGDKKPLSSKSKKRKSSALQDSSAGGEGSSSTALTNASASSSSSTSIWTAATLAGDLAASPLTFTHASHFLAADLAGKIFASPVPEGNDGDPESVQVVFTAAPIYGQNPTDEKDKSRAKSYGKFSIRSHAGRYLSVDAEGGLEATREAIGIQETWELERVEDDQGRGGWTLKGYKGRYLGLGDTAAGKMVPRGDVEESVEWRVKCQTRFKVQDEDEGGGKSGDKAGKVVKEKIGRRELERLAGGDLTDEQVRTLKRAKREGNLNEALLDVRVKKGHDKFAY